MKHKTTRTFLRGILAALMLSAVFAGSASAAPAWKFNGEELKSPEKIVGAAEKSGLTIPGMTTTCENFLYTIVVSNKSGTGEGSITELPLYNCTTNTKCTVTSITAEKLPWAANLSTLSSKNYIIIKGIKVSILYGGKLCVVNGVTAELEGSAGGWLDNTTESATFSPTTFTTTGTELKMLGNKVEWNGFFPTEAFEWHREQALSVS
jgi:hypothetical protein